MRNKKLRLGVVGYCPPTRFDEAKAIRMLRDAYDLVEKDFPDKEIIVVSGITNSGVIKLAYEEARLRKWKTAGVACKKAYDFKDNWFPVDEEPIIIGEKWGDESEVFINSLDAIVRIGLGKQSLKETAELKKRGKPAYEYDLPAIS